MKIQCLQQTLSGKLIKNILLLSLMFLLSFAILAVRTNTVSGTYTSQILMLIKARPFPERSILLSPCGWM